MLSAQKEPPVSRFTMFTNEKRFKFALFRPQRLQSAVEPVVCNT